jgi:hypothetical protein
MTRLPNAVPKPKRTPRCVEPRPKSVRSKTSGGHLFPKNVSQARRRFIRQQRCIATGRKTGELVTAQSWMPETLKQLCPYRAKVVAAHVDSRGAGHADAGDMIPLEWMLHEWAGQIGWARFEKRVGLMPVEEIAAEYEATFQARQAAIQKRLAARG